MTLRSLARLAGATALTAVLLSACGGGNDRGEGADPAAVDQGGASSAVPAGSDNGDAAKATEAGGDLTRDNVIERLTAAQRKAGSSSFRMAIDAGGQSSVAQGQTSSGGDSKSPAIALKIDSKTEGVGTIEMRVVDGQFYMNLGQMTGNKFTRIDLSSSGDDANNQLTELINQVNPATQTEHFAEGLTSFTRAGAATKIDGVQVVPYDLVLDTSKLDGMELVAKRAKTTLPKHLTYTLWIGADDLPRRVSAKIVGMTFDATYTDWGKPVSITAPKTADIVDPAAMAP